MPINYVEAFIFAFLSTAAFAVLFQAPRRTLAISGVIGAVGWVVFSYMRKDLEYDSFYANLCATVVLSLLSELAARIFKHPATTFVIPGIFPIVPGLGMYNGMAKLIENNYEAGVNTLLRAGMDAAAIALGMMFMASFFRVLKLSKEQRRLSRLLPKKR
ncbi:MAG: threonine/serine exporter family protein [Phascolarctobacterium sp.]|uniref:threonine/serine exporter family protein n=1 Tax=Phascolarctobacterium sp. TaxID=2049039 RepID=UPI0026DDAABF|nr:threonine/serine exporter family protein [Phascolarctobacterium sp.]MDO4920863.1 threonine/serine exporter family protein [Phascolarctobacterium sp.]